MALIQVSETTAFPLQAAGLFERMRAEGVSADVIGCNALISACSKGQEWRRALEVLGSMNSARQGGSTGP